MEFCKNGDLESLKKYKGQFDHGGAFQRAAGYGHLDVLKYLISLGGVNIHAYGECAFQWAAENGQLDVLKYLMSLGGVDIHVNDEWAFRLAANNGHLDVLKYLISLGGVDVHVEGDYSFRLAVNNDHLYIVDFLLGVCLSNLEFEFCIAYVAKNKHYHHTINQISKQRTSFQPNIKSSPTNVKFIFM